LGVNLGKLGFLADVDKNDIENAVKRLVEDKFTVDERMMLDTVIVRDGKIIAEDIVLNDVVISREQYPGFCILKHILTMPLWIFIRETG